MVTKNKSSKHKSSKQIMGSSEHWGGIKNGPKIKMITQVTPIVMLYANKQKIRQLNIIFILLNAQNKSHGCL